MEDNHSTQTIEQSTLLADGLQMMMMVILIAVKISPFLWFLIKDGGLMSIW